MNREIKFRAWCKSRGMFNVDVLAIGRCGWDCETSYGVSIAYQPNIEVMQFTGLKDKNGVEIYEGDIVKDFYNRKYKVIYDEYMFNLEDFYNSSYDEPSNAFSEGEYEVIGNIYDNKNLLGEDQS